MEENRVNLTKDEKKAELIVSIKDTIRFIGMFIGIFIGVMSFLFGFFAFAFIKGGPIILIGLLIIVGFILFYVNNLQAAKNYINDQKEPVVIDELHNMNKDEMVKEENKYVKKNGIKKYVYVYCGPELIGKGANKKRLDCIERAKEIINDYAAKGYRYVGYIPRSCTYHSGTPYTMELIFEIEN